jgi:hypothetical protein
MAEIAQDVARLLHPELPALPGETTRDHGRRNGKATEDREKTLGNLLRVQAEHAAEELSFDPLLFKLWELGQARLQIEAQLRRLIAYGRQFVEPEPYKLSDLARSAGMSISGVRSTYSEKKDLLDEVAQIVGRKDRGGKSSFKPSAQPGLPSREPSDAYRDWIQGGSLTGYARNPYYRLRYDLPPAT